MLNVVAPVESQLDELGGYSENFLSYYFVGMCKPKLFDRNWDFQSRHETRLRNVDLFGMLSLKTISVFYVLARSRLILV